MEYRGEIIRRKEAEERELYVFIPMGRKNLLVIFFISSITKLQGGHLYQQKKELSYIKRE